MSETIDVEIDGKMWPFRWDHIGNTEVAKAITTALRELANRMAADGSIIMGDCHNWPEGARKTDLLYGVGWGAMLCAAWLDDALSAIEQGEDPREIG